MASIESVVRFKNAPLLTQQRRLRHLRSIAARNLSWKRKPLSEVVHLQTYFTLHADSKTKAFYTSEKITGSLNPTWRSFVLEMLADIPDLSTTSFLVRIWQCHDCTLNFKVCVEWDVNLTGLSYLGDRLEADGLQHQPNTLIFGMFDGFYSSSIETLHQQDTPVTEAELRDSVLTVDQAWLRNSYSAHTLARIQTILRAIKQTNVTVKRVRRNIEEKLSYSERLQAKKSEREIRIVKVNMMRGDLEWRTMQLQSEKEAYETLQGTNCQKDVALKTRFETLHKDKGRLHEKKKSYFDVREELIKTGAQLVMRRKQLISELVSIYPIRELPDASFTIAGVKLPNSEDFAGHDDTMVAVSLGFSCHLLQMISQFLDIPLRYPMEHRGSRSQITDHIIDKLTDKERDFPLYAKGKEKFQYNYGVYLLNKNMAQVRFYCGLSTADLRLTLTNMKSLLELRLGVKFEPGNSLLPGQHLIPPNLGGPQKMTSPSFGQPIRAKEAGQEAESGAGSSTQDTDSIEQTEHEISKEILNFEKILQESKHREEKQKEEGDGSGGVNSEANSSPDSAEEVFEVDKFQVKMPPPDSANSEQDSNIPSSSATMEKCANANANGESTSSSAPPVIKTLETTTRSKRQTLGAAASYDDVDASSEDSASVTYGSKFKLWPRDSATDRKPNSVEDEKFENENETTKPALPDNFANVNNSCPQPRVMLSSSSDYNPPEDGGVIWDNESSLEQDPCSCASESASEKSEKRTEASWTSYPDSYTDKLGPGEDTPSELKDPPETLSESSQITVSDVSS